MPKDEAIILYKENIKDSGIANVNKSGQASIHRKHAGKEIRWFIMSDKMSVLGGEDTL